MGFQKKFDMKNVLLLAGTRPEIIKLAPLLRAINEDQTFSSTFLFTGQHSDLAYTALNDFRIIPDISIELSKSDHSLSGSLSELLQKIAGAIAKAKPNLMVVQGDTNSALAGAIAGFHQQIPVAHLEAGLRTASKGSPYPEEMNRRLISQISDLHFAPTNSAYANLISEGIDQSSIAMTGNTGIDALLWMRNQLAISTQNTSLSNDSEKCILVTLHRRESQQNDIKNICKGILKFLKENRSYSVLLPVHPNPDVSTTVVRELGNTERCRIVKALSYSEIIDAMMNAEFILTDSGGIQEEAPYLGKRIIVARQSTERQEGIAAGYSRLVQPDENSIHLAMNEQLALAPIRPATNIFGDGNASGRCLSLIKEYFG